MAVFRTKEFGRFARKTGLKDPELFEAATAVAEGRWDADLGGGVFKQRIARAGGGKSGGLRTIILFKAGAHSFLVHGFAKNRTANVTPKELRALKALARVMLDLEPGELETAIAAGELAEVRTDDGGEDES